VHRITHAATIAKYDYLPVVAITLSNQRGDIFHGLDVIVAGYKALQGSQGSIQSVTDGIWHG
jgi:hypothetical protein